MENQLQLSPYLKKLPGFEVDIAKASPYAKGSVFPLIQEAQKQSRGRKQHRFKSSNRKSSLEKYINSRLRENLPYNEEQSKMIYLAKV